MRLREPEPQEASRGVARRPGECQPRLNDPTYVTSFTDVLLRDTALLLGGLDELTGEALDAAGNFLSVGVDDRKGLVRGIKSFLSNLSDVLLGTELVRYGALQVPMAYSHWALRERDVRSVDQVGDRLVDRLARTAGGLNLGLRRVRLRGSSWCQLRKDAPIRNV